MEIGSFIELQFPKGQEYYSGEQNIARLNSGRAAIYHAARVLNCNTVWLPYYQCDTVRGTLKCKGITVKYYHINTYLDLVDIEQKPGEAVVFVNYFGIMSQARMKSLAKQYDNVIIDNSQAFFCKPIEGCMNVYSARKFVGVPDGAYVIGDNAEKYSDEYEKCYSSDTSLFLLQRIEYGCEGKTYESRMINEHRIDSEDIKQMSDLTRAILDGTDYGLIIQKRRENFQTACKLFEDVNCIYPKMYADDDIVPMVYPLLVEDDNLLSKLLQHKHFQGHWWSYLLDEVEKDSFEYWMSRYVIPVTIDQRYGEEELRYIRQLIEN